jgi:nitrite reductase/ring-hydroxylating ferredoxin subunit
MSPKQYQWIRIAEDERELDFAENGICVVEAGSKKICVAKSGEQLFGCSYSCPHAGGILADGYLDAVGNIICPVHRYKFNLSNGRNASGEGYYLKTYPIERRPDGIYIGIEERGALFGWLK